MCVESTQLYILIYHPVIRVKESREGRVKWHPLAIYFLEGFQRACFHASNKPATVTNVPLTRATADTTCSAPNTNKRKLVCTDTRFSLQIHLYLCAMECGPLEYPHHPVYNGNVTGIFGQSGLQSPEWPSFNLEAT